jgi:hypothetical protein
MTACVQELERDLSDRMGVDVRVVFTDNRRSMLSFRERTRGIFELRLHRMFRRADAEVVGALVSYLQGRRGGAASRTVDAFISRNRQEIRGAAAPPPETLRPRGTFHDLQAIYDGLNAEYFGSAVGARITWGRNRLPRGPQRTIRLGTYWDYPTGGLIRIHPALDHSQVPGHVVERIVFHEMLHQVFGIAPGCLHPAEFARAEQRYRHWRRAMNWEHKNLDWLLGRRQLAFHLPTP